MTGICNAGDVAVDGKYIERMPLFRGLGTEVIAETCKCVTDLKMPRDQVRHENVIFVVVATRGHLSAS